jgi:hypothetical protein
MTRPHDQSRRHRERDVPQDMAGVASVARVRGWTAASQCAADIAAVATGEADTHSIEAWATLLHVSASTLKNRLRAVGVAGREALAFGRLVRAIRLGAPDDWRPEDVMAPMDDRTLDSLLRRARVRACRHGARPSLAILFACHQFRIPEAIVEHLSALLHGSALRGSGAATEIAPSPRQQPVVARR